MNEKATALLMADEGLELKMYKDTKGHYTIGVGHNLDAKPISKRAAIVIFEDDMADCDMQLRNNLSFYDSLSPVRQYVLLNMCYNLGIKGLMGFSKTLFKMKIKDYKGAAMEMLDSNPGRDPKLKGRYERLSKALASDEWPPC